MAGPNLKIHYSVLPIVKVSTNQKPKFFFRVTSDMDVPNTHLIAAHSTCSQELVNLLLTGHAVSNVFNDTVQLDSGGEEVTVLKGIQGRCDVGYLTLFEHHKSCQVRIWA